MVPGPSPGQTQRRGVWEPLPLIVYGYAVHPLSPSRRDTRYSNRTRLSTVTEASNDELVHRDVVSLEVGDEVYAFEKYTPKGKEVEGIWYRGYVYNSFINTRSGSYVPDAIIAMSSVQRADRQ